MIFSNYNKFSSFLKKFHFFNRPLHSRMHLLNSLSSKNSNFYIKRDDELSFGVSGCKLRKYAVLEPYLTQNGFDCVIIIGGAYSNNLLAALQVFRENRIHPLVFIDEFRNDFKNATGNFLLSSLFLDKESICFYNSKNSCLKSEIDLYTKKNKDKKIFILDEGGDHFLSLVGLFSLPMDILKNEKDNSIEFDHIFLDAGTGLTAISVILAFAYLKRKTFVHVVSMAIHLNDFNDKLLKYKNDLMSHDICISEENINYCFYHPSQAKSFGSVNSSVFTFIKKFANSEGVILDPIYSAKLFLEIKNINNTKGNCLVVHSGGGMSLFGFEKKLQKLNYCSWT